MDFIKKTFSLNDLITLKQIQGDSSIGKQFQRVKISQKNRNKEIPSSCIFMQISNSSKRSDEYFVVDRLPDQYTQGKLFLTTHQWLSKNIPRIPKLFGYQIIDDQYMFLLEDMGETNLYDLIHQKPRSSIKVCHAFEEMIHWIGHLQSKELEMSKNNPIRLRTFEEKAINLEIKEFINFINILVSKTNKINDNDINNDNINNENNSKHENHKNSLINEKQIIEAYQKLYSNINQKTTLIHRDLQSKNIFYYQQQPYVIDYQDLCLGPWLYDLASLIYDQNAQLNPVERIRLLKIFWLHYGKQVESDWDKFMVSLRKTALIRNMHGIGRHGTIYFTRDRKDSLNRIKRGLNMLLQLQQELVDQKLNLFSVLSINDLINRINQIPL